VAAQRRQPRFRAGGHAHPQRSVTPSPAHFTPTFRPRALPGAGRLSTAADATADQLPDDDPFDLDITLQSDNLSAAASSIRDAFTFV
jgi:hypothetical protein